MFPAGSSSMARRNNLERGGDVLLVDVLHAMASPALDPGLLREIRVVGSLCSVQFPLRAMISRNKYPQRPDFAAFAQKMTPTDPSQRFLE
jgi:hypothetical protein